MAVSPIARILRLPGESGEKFDGKAGVSGTPLLPAKNKHQYITG
jgi:hypothetical protein